MSGFPEVPRAVRGGFVLFNPDTVKALRVIPFQYNPDTVTRTLQPQGIGNEPGDRLEALRLKGPPHESYKFDAEFDATDQLDHPEQNFNEASFGLYPTLSALEMSIYPPSSQLLDEAQLSNQGMVEIAPVESPLLVLVLGGRRVLPVRLTDLTVTEESFDTSLNPIRAKVSIGARVLTVDDVGFYHLGGLLYLGNHFFKEFLAGLVTHTPDELGLGTV